MGNSVDCRCEFFVSNRGMLIAKYKIKIARNRWKNSTYGDSAGNCPAKLSGKRICHYSRPVAEIVYFK